MVKSSRPASDADDCDAMEDESDDVADIVFDQQSGRLEGFK